LCIPAISTEIVEKTYRPAPGSGRKSIEKIYHHPTPFRSSFLPFTCIDLRALFAVAGNALFRGEVAVKPINALMLLMLLQF
jgi:hypothetical protein